MPTLMNAKHERFAQEVAAGKTLHDAHAAAGYKADRRNAEHLRRRDDISQRITEILAERERVLAEISAKAVEKAAVSKSWVLQRLCAVADRCMTAEAVKDHEGSPIGEYTFQAAGANRALELIGKELGMFIDRKDIRVSSLSDLSRDQIQAFLQELDAAVDDNRGHAASGRTTH